MTERGTYGADRDGNRPQIQPEASEPERLGNPTRLVPRQPPPSGFGRAGLGPMFGPRSFGNGRIQVWGCSPGCLIASLIASVVLTLLLNAMF